jgi:hypothetical protein
MAQVRMEGLNTGAWLINEAFVFDINGYTASNKISDDLDRKRRIKTGPCD